MKKVLLTLLAVAVFATSAHATLTGELISKVKEDRRVRVTLECNYNGDVREYVRPIVISSTTTKPEVIQTLKNICLEHKERVLAEAKTDAVDTAINGDIGQPIPVE